MKINLDLINQAKSPRFANPTHGGFDLLRLGPIRQATGKPC
jgi:hypothetical protein